MKYVMIIVIQLLLNINMITDKLDSSFHETNELQKEQKDIKEQETNLSDNELSVNEISEEHNYIPVLEAEEQNMVNLINQTRVENGLNELTLDADLYEIARIRADEITQSFSHTRPNGEPFYSISSIIDGENLSRYGTGDTLDTYNGFMNSPNHKDNILYADFQRVACYRLIENDDVYWVQAFGN